MIKSKLMVPIIAPTKISSISPQIKKANFFFTAQTYQFYTWQEYQLVQDNQFQWYIILDYTCKDLAELKVTRQIQRPNYLTEALLPICDLLETLKLQVDSPNFDKAYAHALYFSPDIMSVSNSYKLKIANYDGDDDPQVTNALHYVKSVYDNEITQFIAGVETNSFATITDSKFYAENIWSEETGLYYLLLFTYFKRYKVCPSEQMLPKLLCNLWASTEVFNTQANPALYLEEKLNY